jgi:hypothetical protein
MKKFILLSLIVWSCIGEDLVFDEVAPEVRISQPISNFQINTSHQFEYVLLNNVGMEAMADQISWSTSNASKVIINQQGEAMALDYGEVTITLTASLQGVEVDTSLTFSITDNPTAFVEEDRGGSINTTTSYDLSGDFTMRTESDELVISFQSNYVADDGLPGLYVYLTNNPNSPNGGYEIGPVQVFNGSHEYRINDVGLYDYNYLFYYCKPFKVKVGHGAIE